MTYIESVKKFARTYGYTQRDVREFIKNLSDFTRESLAVGESVHWKNFVEFNVINQKGRSVFDFQNGTTYLLDDFYVPTVAFTTRYCDAIKADLNRYNCCRKEQADAENITEEE